MPLRKKLPKKIEFELWNRAGGRCERKGCNKPLWRSGLTFSSVKISQIAHIIAASPDGPRGNGNSFALQTDISNLMLLCPECHKEIDDSPDLFLDTELSKQKEEHEQRIKRCTELPPETSKTSCYVLLTNIDNYMPDVGEYQIHKAIEPFFLNCVPHRKIITDFIRESSKDTWKLHAEEIRTDFKSFWESCSCLKGNLTVFALGYIPYLIFLGKVIGDKGVCSVMQKQRNMEPLLEWIWETSVVEDDSQFTFCISDDDALYSQPIEKVNLRLEISDYIGNDKIESSRLDQYPTYSIRVKEPNVDIIRRKSQLRLFSSIYREALNYIQNIRGKDCQINLLPAIPISIAVECGRHLLIAKDNPIAIFDYSSKKNGFIEVLNLI